MSPYIAQETREALGDSLDALIVELRPLVRTVNDDGILNYVITTLLAKVLSLYRGKKIRYAQIERAIGLLECIKQELYRRIAAPHEDKKRDEHGDVF